MLVLLKSNPYKLVEEIYSPICGTTVGLIPSDPPWKGTENLRNVFVGPLIPVVSIEALNDLPACPILALEFTKKLSTLKSPATLLTVFPED